MTRRKISLYCVTEQQWKEVRTRGGITYKCPEDPTHVVQSVVDQGAVQESQVLMTVQMVDTDHGVEFNANNWEPGNHGNVMYFPGTVSLQTQPVQVKLLVRGEKSGEATAFQLREYYGGDVLAEWQGDLWGTYQPQIITLEVGDHADNWPAAEAILALYGWRNSGKVFVHTLSIL